MVGFKNQKEKKELEKEKSENLKLLKSQRKAAKEKAKRQEEKLKQQEENLKRQNARMKKKLKKEAAPKSAQQTIKYKYMFEDGVCQLDSTTFSKTFRFSDINYQIAQRSEQIEIFSRYCEFLNYFDPNINVQLTIHNRQIDQEDFKEQMMLKKRDDDLDEYRNEYNTMLADKALQGQNSIIRDKYLTFAVTAESYNKALPLLNRLETDLMGNFKALGCDNTVLSGHQRLETIHSIINPHEPLSFDYKNLLVSGLTTKDFIAPFYFDFTDKKTFEVGDYVGQVLVLRDLPPDLSDKMLSELSDIPCNLTINLHINSVDNAKALALVKQKLAFMEQQKIDEQRKAINAGYDADMITHELKYSLDEANELLDDMQSKNQRMFKVTMLVYTSALTKEELKDNVYQIQSTARKNGCKLVTLDCLQEAAFNASLPLGKNDIDIKRTLTTASTAIFIPFTTQEIFQEHGMYYGLNALSHNLIFFNRKSLKNPNGFILGTPGSGKSFAVKREIVNILLNSDDEILCIDPEREYTALAEGFGGEVIHISAGSTAHINPLDITMDYSDDDNPLLLKSEFILSLCELIIGGREGLSPGEKTVADRAIRITYNEYFRNPKKNAMPTLQVFYQVLKEQPEIEAKNLALKLELYIKGSLDTFAQPTNIDLSRRFVVFDIRDLGKELKTMGMLIVLDQIWNRITQNRKLGKRTWIPIDEIYLLFQNDYAANYLFELWKRARKWGAIPTGITQNVEDLLLSDTARRMLSNSDFIMMLNQATSDRNELASLLNISEKQLSFVTNTDAGQGLLFAGRSVVPFIDKFPKETKLYNMMTTKIEEVKLHQENK